jgi:hypothetical protein
VTRPEDERPFGRNERAVIMRTGTVTAIHATTLDVMLPGGPMPGVPLGGFTALVGEKVTVLLDRDSALAIGMVGNAGAGTGPPGPPGDEGLVWRGPWSSATSYAVDDAVSDGGSSYIAIAAGTNNPPATSLTYWNVLAAQGSTGPPGEDSTVPGPPGAEGLVWRGAWSSSITYAIDDAVSVGGSSYIAILAGANNPPATSPTYWNVLAAQGAKGDQGIQGIPGPSVPYAMAAGTVTMPTSATQATYGAPTVVTATVGYPAGRFTVAPIFVVSPSTTDGTAAYAVRYYGNSATGCTVACVTADGSFPAAITLSWIAVQMTAGAAPGVAKQGR